jgi:curli biogenesis system outer membrane secretion channel CsgG
MQLSSQAKKRVAVLEFDARNVQNNDIGGRIADGIISELAGSGNFDVVDRDNLARVTQEQNTGYGDRFDMANATRLGKLANVSILIVGRVDAFTANVSKESKQGFLNAKTTESGDVALRVTARVIQVDTGNIMQAPSVESHQNAVLGQTTVYGDASNPLGSSSSHAGSGSGLQKLVDTAVHDVSVQLADKIRSASLAMPAVVVIPKFVGIQDGMVVVNKGQNAGIKAGDKYDVSRQSDTGMKDPDTGQPILRKKKICTLTVSDVEDTISSGKCEGADAPQAGDIFTSAAK